MLTRRLLRLARSRCGGARGPSSPGGQAGPAADQPRPRARRLGPQGRPQDLDGPRELCTRDAPEGIPRVGKESAMPPLLRKQEGKVSPGQGTP